MEKMTNLSDQYELIELIEEGNQYKIYRAEEKSLGAPCHYHEIHPEGDVSPQQWQAAEAVFKRYSQVVHPRAPRLADAWFTHYSLVAVDYHAETTPLSFTTNNPLQKSDGPSFRQLIHETLDLIGTLHGCGVVHGKLHPETFGSGSMNRIYLRHTGMESALLRCFGAIDIANAPLLSTNLYARDLGMLFYHLLSFKLGEPLSSFSLEEEWDDYHIKKVSEKIQTTIKDPALFEFCINCIGGLAAGSRKFEKADDAMTYWKKYLTQEGQES